RLVQTRLPEIPIQLQTLPRPGAPSPPQRIQHQSTGDAEEMKASMQAVKIALEPHHPPGFRKVGSSRILSSVNGANDEHVCVCVCAWACQVWVAFHGQGVPIGSPSPSQERSQLPSWEMDSSQLDCPRAGRCPKQAAEAPVTVSCGMGRLD
ncbi:hypothetical protein CORC01_01058, partial [Colletotrichum orchidophilum]